MNADLKKTLWVYTEKVLTFLVSWFLIRVLILSAFIRANPRPNLLSRYRHFFNCGQICASDPNFAPLQMKTGILRSSA